MLTIAVRAVVLSGLSGILTLCSAGHGISLDATVAALEVCDYKIGVPALQRLAEGGDGSAQRQLSDLYQTGIGVSVDAAEAEKWKRRSFNTYLKAAENGDPGGAYVLGSSLQRGSFGPKDEAKGKEWLAKARKLQTEKAESGDVEAQYDLAQRLSWTDRGSPEREESNRWYERALPAIRAAAEHGDQNAQDRLASMYQYGHGVVENKDEAAKWYMAEVPALSAAADKGDETAILSLYGFVWLEQPGASKDERAKRWHDIVVTRHRVAAAAGCIPAQAWLADRAEARQFQHKEAKYEALMWWSIIQSSTDSRYAPTIARAREATSEKWVSSVERELALNKAARCVQTNYKICE